MPTTVNPQLPAELKIIPDYSPNTVIRNTTIPPLPAATIKLKDQVNISQSPYDKTYNFNIGSEFEATTANTLYPLAWSQYFNDGTTYASSPYTPKRAEQLLKAINFYLYFNVKEETNTEFDVNSGELVDKPEELFQSFESTFQEHTYTKLEDAVPSQPLRLEKSNGENDTFSYSNFDSPINPYSSDTIKLSDLYYGTDQVQGNTNKQPINLLSTQLNITLAQAQVSGLAFFNGAYAGGRPLLR